MTTRMSRYQKEKTNLDFTEARDSEWQWHQLAVCKSVPRSSQITTPAPHHSVFYGPDALPAAQPTASKHWRIKNLPHTSTKNAMHTFCTVLVFKWYGVVQGTPTDDWWVRPVQGLFTLPPSAPHSWTNSQQGGSGDNKLEYSDTHTTHR